MNSPLNYSSNNSAVFKHDASVKSPKNGAIYNLKDVLIKKNIRGRLIKLINDSIIKDKDKVDQELVWNLIN